jgi:hypothetical protein
MDRKKELKKKPLKTKKEKRDEKNQRNITRPFAPA